MSNLNSLNNLNVLVEDSKTVLAEVGGSFEGSLELEKLGETLGEFKPYDSQLPVADIAGTRIVKCLYQKSKDTKKETKANAYVRIPCKHLTEELIVERIADLTPYILDFLQTKEDEVIKENHKNGILNVFTASLSIDSLIDYLEEKGEGARLNKDKIEKWFKDSLYTSLLEQFAAKMMITENSNETELIKLETVINAYKKKYVSLASGKTYIKEDDCKAMIAVIVKCEAQETLLGKRFINRLEQMNKKTDELLLSL